MSLCKCGCGQVTARNKQNDYVRGVKFGEYNQFVRGHFHIWKRQQNPNWGKQYARLKLREELRPRLRAGEDVRQHFTTPEGYSVFRNFTLNYSISPLAFPAIVRSRSETFEELIQRRERLQNERKERSNNKVLVSDTFRFRSLDCEFFHSMLACPSRNPLEELMYKEDMEEREANQRLAFYASRIRKMRSADQAQLKVAIKDTEFASLLDGLFDD